MQANSVNPYKTAMVGIYTVCHLAQKVVTYCLYMVYGDSGPEIWSRFTINHIYIYCF